MKGWIALYNCTVIEIGNKLRIQATGRNPYARYIYASDINKVYEIKIKIEKKTSANPKVYLSSTFIVDEYDYGIIHLKDDNIEYNMSLEAVNNTIYIKPMAEHASDGDYFDIVSMSINNKSII